MAATATNDEIITSRCALCPDWEFTGPTEEAKAEFSDHMREEHGAASTGRGVSRWNAQGCIAAVQAFEKATGRWPTQKDTVGDPSLPAPSTVRELLGTWDDLIVTASGIEPVEAAEPKTRRLPRRMRKTRERLWPRERQIQAFNDWVELHGQPPTSTAWTNAGDHHPSTSTVCSEFGSWNEFRVACGHEPAGKGRPRLPKLSWEVNVKGTGLKYRTVMEAVTAADQIEYEGKQTADRARDDGNEGAADEALRASGELAEKIRAAAREADPDSVHETPDSVHETVQKVAQEYADPIPDLHTETPGNGLAERNGHAETHIEPERPEARRWHPTHTSAAIAAPDSVHENPLEWTLALSGDFAGDARKVRAEAERLRHQARALDVIAGGLEILAETNAV